MSSAQVAASQMLANNMIAHVWREWCMLVTVVIVLILKYLYEPKEEVSWIGPQLVKLGSLS